MTATKLNAIFAKAEGMLSNYVTDSRAGPLRDVSSNLFTDFVTALRRDLPKHDLFKTAVWNLSQLRARTNKNGHDQPLVDKGDCLDIMTCAAGLAAQIKPAEASHE